MILEEVKPMAKMEHTIEIEMGDDFADVFNIVRSEHENIMQRIDQIEGKLVFDHENKLKTIYGKLRSELLDEFRLTGQYHRACDKHNEEIHASNYAVLERTIDLLEAFYPWLNKEG
jgi:hypothetical protein